MEFTVFPTRDLENMVDADFFHFSFLPEQYENVSTNNMENMENFGLLCNGFKSTLSLHRFRD